MGGVLKFENSGGFHWNIQSMERFLRIIGDPQERRNIVHRHGNNADSISRYEADNDLPSGAFEVVVMLNAL
jgi:hypothetical protein